MRGYNVKLICWLFLNNIKNVFCVFGFVGNKVIFLGCCIINGCLNFVIYVVVLKNLVYGFII